MIIELPENHDYQGRAFVQDGILKIYNASDWEAISYELMIEKYGKVCYYCGRQLKDKEITVDHLYPQSFGGQTFPANIATSCKKCNTEKSNLTEKQYADLLKWTGEARKKFRVRWIQNNAARRETRGYLLPNEWITKQKTVNVGPGICIDNRTPGVKYTIIENFYKTYHVLPYPIVVEKNNRILDGFWTWWFAYQNNIRWISTIIQENVEIVKR